ncbi:hypothetical protein [Streptomyces sp. NPDC017940]|uniref:hypothetical protein n=1 Tax=Streptomyces sp. NPDC017940 TaxID=3365017 RepID=UPI003787272A
MPRATAPDYTTTTWPEDPTHDEVRSLAAYIAARLPRPGDCTNPTLRPLLEETHALLDTDDLPVQATEQVSAAIDRLRLHTYATHAGRLYSDLAPAAWALVRTARSAATGGCRLGSGSACDGDGRVRLFIYDTFVSEKPPGCPQHAADEATRWDHGRSVEVVLVGPEEACLDTQARIGSRLSPAPKWVPVPPRSA